VLFLEDQARWLLVLHTVIAAALVASSTHLVVWMRGYLRGSFKRQQGVRKLSVISASLFGVTLLIGNLIYPVYKVRVRLEYLEHGSALTADYKERVRSRSRVRIQHERLQHARGKGPPVNEAAVEAANQPDLRALSGMPKRAAKVARWFDVKEHWVALGFGLSVGCMVILLVWDPRKHNTAVAPMVFGLALGAAATTWIGAIIGVVVTSFRSIGGFG
jgi:hypothetical protein